MVESAEEKAGQRRRDSDPDQPRIEIRQVDRGQRDGRSPGVGSEPHEREEGEETGETGTELENLARAELIAVDGGSPRG